MTITGEEALQIASSASQKEGWGVLTANKYQVHKFDFEGRPAWQVSRSEIVIGSQVWFVIDAETGAVLKKNCLGIR